MPIAQNVIIRMAEVKATFLIDKTINEMKFTRYIWFALLYPCVSFSQTEICPKKFCQPMSLYGAFKLGAQYRYQEGTTNEIYDIRQSPLYYGGILINTSGYFWHPNFMTLDIGGEFNPEINEDSYITIPDQSEVRTLSRFNLLATFLSKKPVTFSIYTNYNQVYANRENLSNIRTNSFNYGGNLSYSNKILPIQVNFSKGKWDEKEIQTGRTYSTNQCNLQGIINKSFSTRDKNELMYFHNELFREEPQSIKTQNISDNLNLKNNIFFDASRRQSLNSYISATDQRGSDEFRRLQANENLIFKLPLHMDLNGNYSFTAIQRAKQTTKQNNINLLLRHKLYESLTSSLIYEYNHISNTFYKDSYHRPGIDIRYDKKIPSGRLSLSTSYYRLHQNRNSGTELLPIINEEHVLSTGKIELLTYPNIVTGSVVVKDITGTIIYQEYFDYTLIERNSYLEISRVPGGQIAENSTIYVDYTVNQPGSYRYDANILNFNASVLILKNLLEIYYRFSYQDFQNMENTEFLTLNYLTQNVFGARVEYKFASAGAEYESYNSTVIPYRLMRYFLVLQGNIKSKLLYSVNANYRDYKMLDDNTVQKYTDLAGNVSYMISQQTKVTLELGYRKQVGQGIDLNLLTARSEFTANYRKLFFKVGVEVYKRLYLNDNINFFGAYFEVVRSFNWNKR
jgi:hypothetical protein